MVLIQIFENFKGLKTFRAHNSAETKMSLCRLYLS